MRFNKIRWSATFFGLSVLAFAIALASQGLTAQEKEGAEVTVSARASKIDAAGKQTVTVTFVMKKDWHIGANPIKNAKLADNETQVTIKAKVKLADTRIAFPAGKAHEDKRDGKSMVYEDKAIVQINVQRAAGDTSPLEVEYYFIACNDVLGQCLLPKRDKLTIP